MIGKVAKCRAGATGLILSARKSRSDSITGSDRILYQGVCLNKGIVGQAWQSLHPKVIGTLDDWVKIRHTEIENTTDVHVSYRTADGWKRLVVPIVWSCASKEGWANEGAATVPASVDDTLLKGTC